MSLLKDYRHLERQYHWKLFDEICRSEGSLSVEERNVGELGSTGKLTGDVFHDVSFIELDDGKIYRKPLYLMVKTMVSCRFSLKPIHWFMMFHDVSWRAMIPLLLHFFTPAISSSVFRLFTPRCFWAQLLAIRSAFLLQGTPNFHVVQIPILAAWTS